MHTFKQVKEVIEYNKMIHGRLRMFFAALNENRQPERVTMMLNFLIGEHGHSEEILTRFKAECHLSILNSWMQFSPSINIYELIDNHIAEAFMSLGQLVQLVAEINEVLISFYHEASNESELPKVRLIFDNLAEMEVNDNQKQLRASLFESM